MHQPAQNDLFAGYGTDAQKLSRRDDPATSHAAAAQVDSTRLERMVHQRIARYGERGATASQLLHDFKDHPYSSITARFSALERKGFITCGPDKRDGDSGRKQRVMRSIKAPAE